jgi:hypothetical protein
MANTLFDATVTPALVRSGALVTVRVSCEVSAAGSMIVGSSNGYTITTTKRALAGGQISDTFTETITGPPGDCHLTFVFQGSGIETVVTIQ